MFWHRRLIALAAVAFACVSVGLSARPASAQGTAADAGADKKITLDLRDIPLRDAIGLLFKGSGLQYTIDPNIQNVPITLNIRDIALPAALRLIVRQAAVSMPGLTSAKEGDIYMVRIRQAAPTTAPPVEEAPPDQQASDQDLTWEKIPIQFNNVAVFALAFGGTMLPTEQDVLLNSSGGGMGGGMGGGYGGMGGGMGGGMMGGGMGGGMMGGMGGGMMGGMGGGMMGGMGGGMMGGGMMGGMGGGMMGGGMGGFGGGGMMGGGGLGGGRRF